MKNDKKDLGVIVNYFTNYTTSESHSILISTSELSLRLLKINPSVSDIILVDGSGKPDIEMKCIRENIGAN